MLIVVMTVVMTAVMTVVAMTVGDFDPNGAPPLTFVIPSQCVRNSRTELKR